MVPYILSQRRRWAPYLAWAVLLFVVLFWRLGTPSFWDPDEAHYAETTRELIVARDWLAPYYNQRPFFDKPILFHLLQALPMSLLGPTEFAARLVPALAALALIGTTWWLGVAFGSSEIGFVAGLLLTVSPGVFALVRYAILDTAFTAFLFGGVALIAVAALRDRTRLQYPGYVLVGLAVLTKGPIALVLCGLAFAVSVSVSAEARVRLLRLRWLVGLIIAVAVASPWFCYMLWRFGRAFVDGYWLDENVILFARPRYGNQPGWYFYFQILAAALLPWTGLVFGRMYDDIRSIVTKRPLDTFEVLLWSWTIAIVGFFSLSQFKLDHYVFPAAPALCLLCARAWADVRGLRFEGFNSGARWGFHLIGPLLIVIGLVGGIELTARLELPVAAAVVPSALIAAGAALIGRMMRGRDPIAAPWFIVGALGFTYAGLILWVMPALERGKVVPDVARWVAQHSRAADRICTYRLNRWSPAFRFYVDRPTVMLESTDEARRFFDDQRPSYCVMTSASYEHLLSEGLALDIVHSREGMWATSGRALWRRRDPLTNFVVVKRSTTTPGSPPTARPPDI